MFENICAITRNASSKKANYYVLISLLALLSGCTGTNTAKTGTPAPEANICTSATDTFCVEGDKDKGARLNKQGIEYAAKKEYDKAIDQFIQAIQMDNSNPEFHYNLGVTYSMKGMHEEEEASYMGVLAIEPEDPKLNPALANTYFNLACMYATQGKKDRAFEQLEKLFSVDPNTLYHQLQSDEDLKSLREDPRFKQLLAKRPGNNEPPAEEPVFNVEVTPQPEEAPSP